MDFIKDFEDNFLTDWCKQNHMGKPRKRFSQRWWTAWRGYQKERLPQIHKDVVQEYLSMKFKERPKEEMLRKIPEFVQQNIEETENIVEENKEETISDWEKVQRYLK